MIPKTIRSIKDVETFAQELVKEGVNFHPDDDFFDYVNYKTGQPTYSQEEAVKRNKLMTQAFSVCESKHFDIYAVMNRIFLLETGMHKFIPLPSELTLEG